MEVDTVTRTVTIPDELEAALTRDTKAKAIFEGLSYSHRKEYVDWITSAKRPETRARRIDDAMRRILKKKRAVITASPAAPLRPAPEP
jgi:uncharacterized protein YdeI (YjbR/CyaY-like superfamily)